MSETLLRRIELGVDAPPLAENEYPYIEVEESLDIESILVFARTALNNILQNNLLLFAKTPPVVDDQDRLARAYVLVLTPPTDYWLRPVEGRAQEYFEQLLPKEEPISPPRLTEEERRRNIEYFSNPRFAMSEEDKRTLLDRINRPSREVD